LQNVSTTNAICNGPFVESVTDEGCGEHVIVGDEVVQLNVTVPVVPGFAVNTTPTGSVPPGATGGKVPPGGGLIVSLIGVFDTVRDAVPDTVPSVAVIVTGPPTPTPVASPVPAPTLATSVFDDFHVDCVVTSFVELSENVPVAVNCCVPFTAMVAMLGVTAIDFSVAVVVTVTVAEPVIVAVTVSVAVIICAPAVFSVTANVPVPLVSVESAGSTACASVLVK
jgi:hypothetical protein